VERPIPGVLAPEAAGASPVAAELSSFSRNALSLRVQAPSKGVVVVNEAYYPGWEATVDGKPAPIIAANHGFRGVVVEAGDHRISMRYDPLGYKLLGGMSILGFLGVAGFLVWPRRRKT
jgi:uncharacterized membrane protein YfhO